MESPLSLPSAVLDSVTDRILILDAATLGIRYANRTFLSPFGVPLSAVQGKLCRDLDPARAFPCMRNGAGCAARDTVKTGAPSSLLLVAGNGGGRTTEFEVTAYPLRDRDGTVSHVIEILRETAAGAHPERGLPRRTDLFETILQASPDGIVGNDRAGNIFLFNAGAERIFGYSREEVIGKVDVSRLYPPGVARQVKKRIYSGEDGGSGRLVDFETPILTREGNLLPVRLSCALLDDRGKEIGTVGFFQDISSREEILRKIKESEAKFRGIVESAGDAILTIGEDRTIVMANRAAEEMLGYRSGEMAGLGLRDLFPPEVADNWELLAHYAASENVPAEKKPVEITPRRKEGDRIPVHMTLSETRTPEGKRAQTAILRDISHWKSYEEELRVLSITDPLTRLYNRRHFQSLARKELERAVRKKTPFSILMIDIDDFKSFNDRYGHPEGDRLLQETAELIRKTFRSMDSGFRFGGEEFVVLLPETDSFGATISAERFRIRFSDLEFRPAPGEARVTMTASVGLAEYRDGYDLEEMLRCADLAMYAAKNAGRNRCMSYECLTEGLRSQMDRE